MQNKPAGKTLLIIEDDVEILEILEMIFLTEGYQVFASENGAETRDLSSISPDLILLDVRLSIAGNEGQEICMRLKGQQSTSHIPIILLSAEMGLREISLSCGANGYVCKPFDVENLSSKVRKLACA